jgi:hypothetical protein
VALNSRTGTCGKGYPYVVCAGVNSLQDAVANGMAEAAEALGGAGMAIPCTH